jgi:hypothetical protein
VPAIDLIRQLVDLHRAQIAGVVDVRGVGRLKRIYADAREELAHKLRRLQVAGKGDTFTATHLRAVMAQVTQTLRDFEKPLEDHMVSTGRLAATVGPRQVANMIGSVEEHLGKMTPVIQAAQVAVVRGVYPSIAPTLLDKFKRSSKLYGPQALLSIRTGLAHSMIQGETVDEAVDRLVDSNPRKGLFEGQRWRAERIVRTEMSYATNASTQRAMSEFRATAVPKLLKRLVATRDDREGDDSKELDGQTVPVDQPFVWQVKNSKGEVVKTVTYLHPPNRPGDREIVIPWQSAWGNPSTVAAAGDVRPSTAGLSNI